MGGVVGQLVVISCFLIVGIKGDVPRSGPFDWIMEKIERCADSGTNESIFPTKLYKLSNSKTVLNGWFTISPTMDEKSKVYIDFQQWGNQGYRPRGFQLTFKTCEKIWREMGDILKQLFESAGVDVTGCPIPADGIVLFTRSTARTLHLCRHLKQHFGGKHFSKDDGVEKAVFKWLFEGNYTLHNLVFNTTLTRMPVMMYNKYRIIINWIHAGRKVGCGMYYAEAVPKSNG